MDTPPLIDAPASLEETLDRLAQTDWFAIDTEFIREETYWPRLCLVQVATPGFVACIDPLALDDLGGLFALMQDPGITKVFHAAGQDLEIFHHLTGKVPAPVFDTQVAAPLLGHPEQAGFARLVSGLLGIDLAKGHARTDWSRRPLPAEALAYAADDVRYLVPLYEKIHAELAARGRLEWLEPEFARLTDPARYDPPAADAWQRVKGGDRLPDRGRATLQVLAEWRENTARDQDVPRGRIARDDVLVDIARSQPKSRDQLARMRSVRGPLMDRHGDRLLELVAESRQTQPPLPAKRGRQVTLDASGEALTDALSAVIRLRAEEVDLNPASLASRKDLARIASGEAAHEVLAGWRAPLVADDLDAVAAGRSGLRVTQGRLSVLDD
ncbi:MAG: ribonuclease D [Halofilum sp. (in: g-proteobacteria)]